MTEKSKKNSLFQPLPKHLQFIIDQAVKDIEPKKIWIFGSRARGDARPESDFDLAFQFQNKKNWPKFTLKIKEDTPSLYQYDLVDIDSIDLDFQKKIKSEGDIIYEC